MSNYPLDKKMLEEEYGDLLIKAALREYAIEQSERLEREAAGEEPLPPADDRVIRGHSGGRRGRMAARCCLPVPKRPLPGWRWYFWRRRLPSPRRLRFRRRKKADRAAKGAGDHPVLHR